LYSWHAYDKTDFLEKTYKFFKSSLNDISKISESIFSTKPPLLKT